MDADPAGGWRVTAFSLWSDDQRRFNGYAPSPFPDHRDDELREFVKPFVKAGAVAVAAAGAASSEGGRRVICAYAERASSLAVRTRDRRLLIEATVALVLGGLDHNDLGALMRMPLIEDAARRLGADLPSLFEDAAKIVGHPGSAALMLWLTRKPEDRSLESMGYEAHDDPAGFRYRWVS